jgi:hypothetical protein
MKTAAEALAECLGRGIRQAECSELVGSQLVDGVYCDGTIVQGADGRRCVPRETVDRVLGARAAAPLPRAALPDNPVSVGMVAILAGVALAIVFAWKAVR